MKSASSGLSALTRSLNYRVDGRAVKYAPIVFHDKDEKNFPTNVNWFLDRTSLWFRDKNCNVCLYKGELDERADNPKYSDWLKPWLLHHGRPSECGGSVNDDDSYERPDRKKERTFYFKDVEDKYKQGSTNQADWITYVHIYQNADDAQHGPGGTTIQYWRFYAHNGLPPEHGGDWEGIHIVLDRNDTPQIVRLLRHTNIDIKSWGEMRKEGDHPKIYVGKGGHDSRSEGDENGRRHNTWEVGNLVDVGDRTWASSSETMFIYYSGLWGSIGGGLIPGKGYWGPAFNETEEKPNGFITAWCEGRANATDAECSRNYTEQ